MESPENTSILLQIIAELKSELFAIKIKISLVKEKRKIAHEKRRKKLANNSMDTSTPFDNDCFNFDDIYESLNDC